MQHDRGATYHQYPRKKEAFAQAVPREKGTPPKEAEAQSFLVKRDKTRLTVANSGVLSSYGGCSAVF